MLPSSIDITTNFTDNGKTYYTTNDGDELWAIATANHTSTGYLATINHLHRTVEPFSAGKKLIIAINN